MSVYIFILTSEAILTIVLSRLNLSKAFAVKELKISQPLIDLTILIHIQNLYIHTVYNCYDFTFVSPSS